MQETGSETHAYKKMTKLQAPLQQNNTVNGLSQAYKAEVLLLQS